MSIIAYLGTCKTDTLVYLSYIYIAHGGQGKVQDSHVAMLMPSEVPKQLLTSIYQMYCINYMSLLQGTKHQV